MIEKMELPNGWFLTKIENISDYIQRGKSPKYCEHSALPVINQKCIRWNGIDLRYLKYIHKDQWPSLSEERFLVDEDILWNSTGTGTIGRACIYRDKYLEKAVVDSHVTIVRANRRLVLPVYALLFISSPFVQQKIEEMQSGSTNQVELGRAAIAETTFPLPPLAEQHRIVAKIEELFSSLDKGVESLKTAQAQLKTYRQAVLKWAFEGKLTNENVKDGEFPEGWKEKKVSEIAKSFGGYAFKSGDFKKSGKYQVLRIGNIRPGTLRYDESPVFLESVDATVLDRALLHIEDLIITQTGTKGKRDYGFTALIPKNNLLLNQRIVAIRCNEKCLPKYLLYFTWTDNFKNQFFSGETGNVGQGNVGMSGVTDAVILIPDVIEQTRIVSEIEKRLSVCDKLEESITQSFSQAEALRQSILKKAFEGRLVPQDPNDEPASVLLERIRAEKTAAAAAKKDTTGRKRKKDSINE